MRNDNASTVGKTSQSGTSGEGDNVSTVAIAASSERSSGGPRITRPDAPRAIARMNEEALTHASNDIDNALQTLVQALSEAKTPTVMKVHSQLKEWATLLENVERMTKAMLVDEVTRLGTVTTEKGSRELVVGNKLLAIRPHKTGLDAKRVEALLRAKGLSVDELMDKKVTYILNDTRLASAVDNGELTKDELETCRPETTWVLQPIKGVKTDE